MSILLLVELPEGFSQKDELAITVNQRSAIASLLLPLASPPEFRIPIRPASGMVTKRFDGTVRDNRLPAPKPRGQSCNRTCASPGIAGPRCRAAHRAADGVSPLRHPSLTPSRVSALRASLANSATGCVAVGWFAVPFTVSRRSRRQGLRAPTLRLCACVLAAVFEP